MTTKAAPDYGLDAPGVVRTLLLLGGAGIALWASTVAGLWSGVLSFGPILGVVVSLPLGPSGIWVGVSLLAMGLWMVWSSKVGKIRDREHLLNYVTWTGDERVLDVGCGRGLLLIGAAKRLTTGRATGIDIWQAVDLSGNRAESTVENARREGVQDRVDVQTADMRTLPFPDGTFDVVVSRYAIHNLSKPGDRAGSIREIARVLKPGGRAIIDDIRHVRDYTATFATSGCRDIQSVGSRLMMVFLAIVTWGSLRPATIVARKDRVAQT